MESSSDGLKEFRRIYKEEYGKDLTYEEAKEAGANLVNFFKLLIEIDQRNKQDKKKDDNNEKYRF